jgi:hypothetical protein
MPKPPILINHRNVPRVVAAPKVIKNGLLVPATKETEFVTEEVAQLNRQVDVANGKAAQAESALKIKSAELAATRKLLDDARVEATAAHKRVATIEATGKVPQQVEIVEVDDMLRRDDVAVLQALCSVDGHVGPMEVIVPIAQLKLMLKMKREG